MVANVVRRSQAHMGVCDLVRDHVREAAKAQPYVPRIGKKHVEMLVITFIPYAWFFYVMNYGIINEVTEE